MLTHTQASLVRSLLRMARQDRPARVADLAEELGLSNAATRSVLAALDAQGLVDAGRARLTMAGLVIAASLDATSRHEAA